MVIWNCLEGLLMSDYLLIFDIVLFIVIIRYISSQQNDLKKKRDDLQRETKLMKEKLDEDKRAFENRKTEFQQVITEKSQNYPWMAKLYSDYMLAIDEHISAKLRYKSHPVKLLKKRESFKKLTNY